MEIKEIREQWYNMFKENEPVVEKRIAEGIEKNRKGSCKLRITDKNGNPLKNTFIKINQKTHDFKYGANIFMLDEFESEEENRKYREIFKEYFNLATVPFYWDGLEPEQGKPRFDKDSPKVYRRPAPELCVEYCEQNGIDAKLHCLVYEHFIPDWLPKKDLEKMEKLYDERIRKIAERFSGRLYEFEVINETLLEEEWDCQSVISEKRDVIEWSFDLARKYLPNETLVINEGNPIIPLAKQDYRNPYFMMIEKCLQNGASIDKIGLQHHIFTGADAKTDEEYIKQMQNHKSLANAKLIYKGLDIISEFGLPLEITEVTFPTFGDTKEDEDLQAEILKNMYSVWFSHPAVEGVVYWNTVDNTAYITSENRTWNENKCRGGLFHRDLTPKKSAIMLKKLFTEIWHTDLELFTDKDGFVEFNGFYGEYDIEIDGKKEKLGLHKNNSKINEITV